MINLNTVLVEDEGVALRRLQKFVAVLPLITVVGTAKSGLEAIQVINKSKPDLILLDVELKDMTAFDLLKEISTDLNPQIIFITAYDKFAVQAFSLEATDYLQKPYDFDRLKKALEKAIEKKEHLYLKNLLKGFNQESTQSKIQVTEGNKIHHLKTSEIVWIEADGYYSRIHKENGDSVLIRQTLKGLHSELPSFFKRMNRSSIINAEHIVKETKNIANYSVTLSNGIEVKLSDNFNEMNR